MKKTNKGFTLLELSIVMVILGLLVAGMLESSRVYMKRNRVLTTRERLNTIQRAIESYILKHSKLPCPASLTDSKKSSNFGVEIENCDTSTNSGIFKENSGNFIIGAVPIVTLGLPIDMMKDEYSDKITYIVHKNFISDFAKATIPDNLSSRIVIKDGLSEITDSAIYVLISHGENRAGAYGFSTGKQYSSSNSTNEEKFNIHNQTLFNGNIYIKAINNSFDDLVRYDTKENLILSLAWRDIGCDISDINVLRMSTDSCGSGFEDFSTSFEYLLYFDTIETPATTTITNADGTKSRRYCVAKCFDFGRIGFYNITKVETIVP